MNNLLLSEKIMLWQYVKDLPAAVEWYSDVFGIQSTDNIGVAYFFSLNEHTGLALSQLFMGQADELPKSVMLDLQSNDIYETHRMLKEKGVRVGEIENPAWIYHEFYLWDLEDNQIRIHGFVHNQDETM
ncbi:VOC family protein [Paenibacillus silvisoli]|uniref:VOC family protein n=1 Tax=Paenibacillus silvisoli TaxID=3110539 RepID=UPI002803E5AB|nr:VOC family protein [Paenibacillus silvisoli]